MLLEKIRIKNFRSLRDFTIDTKALTVLVGSNDEGKSNVLRALDLFFNHDRDGDHQLSWGRDYCAFATKRVRKASEIEISLTFRLPENYSLSERLVWIKRWRQEGIVLDEIQTESKSPLPGRSRAVAFLRSIRYDYVPAVKGEEYFQRLLTAVYDMLDSTVRESIRGAATGFTGEIRQHTGQILAELDSRLKLKSQIQLPTDLRRLFSELEFHSERQGYAVTLAQRGDGIKVRHIPIILRWLAEQANHLSTKGRPRVVSIWGYEEPENNLEIRRAFELAKEFLDTSASIPTLLTTHSPVFYSAFKDADPAAVTIQEISFSPDLGTIAQERSGAENTETLDSATGLLDLLRPYLRDWQKQVEALRTKLRSAIDTNIPTIFVEGPTDKIVLDAIKERFFPESSQLQICCSTENGGGHGWVKDSLVAWHYRRSTAVAIGLFDNEEAVKPSIQEFNSMVSGSTRARAVKLSAEGFALSLRKKKFKVPVALEELYPAEAWNHAESSGWLVTRSNMLSLYNFTKTDTAFDDYLEEKLDNPTERLMASKCIVREHKEALAKLVVKQIRSTDSKWDFEPLRKNLEQVLDKL
ncbi:AAA family ATPase [Cupriavidus sp. WKF15]|uniref:ATP-dependent nuclease n=1 Tax=Cupriavidus sp. WKF15 TaxID=3032282 RepID=UPI0023E121BC|nr:AAA family ATPase [Cupriavidus sp. WKF15]WER45593.1 AAA family ATPase [Cupriavidus sp. WKF15]